MQLWKNVHPACFDGEARQAPGFYKGIPNCTDTAVDYVTGDFERDALFPDEGIFSIQNQAPGESRTEGELLSPGRGGSKQGARGCVSHCVVVHTRTEVDGH